MKKNNLIFIILSALLALICIAVACIYSFNKKEGSTPYENIVENGYTGTEEELLNALADEEKGTEKDGKQPPSAYDAATQKGYTGTKEAWLDALTGDKSSADKYTDGNSVYDIAADNGFKGSLEEWLESLKEPLDKEADTTEEGKKPDSSKEAAVQDGFTVIFKGYDGAELKSEVVKKGEAATPPASPQRKGYTFIGWDRDFSAVEDDMIITAMFEKITRPAIIVDRVDSSADEKGVEVNISVKNNPGIASLNLNVAYAPELTFKKVKYNKELKGQSMKPGQEESPVRLTWVSPFEDVTGDWIFATLYFDVAENAKGDLPIYVTYDAENVYNMKEENIYFEVVNGAIAITN